LEKGHVQKLIVVVTGVDTKDVLERWVFNVETDKGTLEGTRYASLCRQLKGLAWIVFFSSAPKKKSMKDIKNEIQAIIRQITASVTFLPMLDEPCSFDLLIYTDNETQVPKLWEESDPQFIADSTDVQLRSFTTKVGK
jgi:mitotic spindle assembly checkpoint protein MAD2